MDQFQGGQVNHTPNVIVSGGTSSGKTTLLGVLSTFVPEEERLVTIEDAAELRLAKPHVVSLEARPANVEGKGEVTVRDLVRNALRMRPDRIIVGEVRGGEAIDMLQAMNTGHDGLLSTAHANPANRTPQPTGWEPPTGELGPVAPRICRPKDKPVEIPETRYATTADGQRLAYQTLGEHPVDVLSMGAYFSNLEHIWAEPTIARMNRRLSTLGRLILLDGRGTGLSDPIPEGRLPTLEERIDDMKAVLDAVAAERVALVSFANSGPLCCLFAATYPDRTLALVLCNTSPRMAWAPDYPWGIDPDEYEHRLADTATRWGTREYAAEIVRNGSPSRAEDTALIDWWEASMRQSASPEAAATLLRMYYEMDVRDILPAIHVPTLVLSRGGELAEESAATAGRIPGAVHAVMPGHDRVVIGGHSDSYCDAIQEFVRRVRDEEADLDRVLATVLFTDIVGSTERAAALGDRAWKKLVERHHSFVRGTLPRWRGREQDTAGDGFFAAFDGPARAIRCALAIVEGIHSIGLEVRAGIHTGECEMIDTKVGGLTVAIGARVASEAGPSEVLVSQTVKDLVAGCGLEFEGRGEHELKGVPDRWRLYRVASERA